jgi:hypothetical protein
MADDLNWKPMAVARVGRGFMLKLLRVASPTAGPNNVTMPFGSLAKKVATEEEDSVFDLAWLVP